MFDDPLDEDVSLDITPLIDVVFMLLIFFIMTTTFNKPVLDIVLPQSDTAAEPTNGEELMVAVKEDGTYWYQQTQMNKDEIKALLDAHPEAMLNLYVDENTPFQHFVGLVDLARQRPGGRFVISTRTTD